MKKIKLCILAAAAAATALVSGCANLPAGSENIHLITEAEAKAQECVHLDYAGSASALVINGKARNTAVILKKALRVRGTTHITYTKGEPGFAFTKANLWKCPNPDFVTSDPATVRYAEDYFGHL